MGRLQSFSAAVDASASAASLSGSPQYDFTFDEPSDHTCGLAIVEQLYHVCDEQSTDIPVEREREVRSAQTEGVGEDASGQILTKRTRFQCKGDACQLGSCRGR